MGFWRNPIEEVYGETSPATLLDAQDDERSELSAAKSIQAGKPSRPCMRSGQAADETAEAAQASDLFLETYAPKYPKATL